MNQSANVEKLSDLTISSSVKAEGKESNGLDLHGSPENNLFFVKEFANSMDKTSDFRLKEGSPASGNGHALPEGAAKILGVSANVPMDRGTLVNVAQSDDVVPGAGDAPTDNVNNGGKAADNSDKAANNNGDSDGNANNGDKANNGNKVANSGDKANNGGKADSNGSTVTDGATDTDGKDAQGANPSNPKAGVGQRNSGIAKPGGNAQGGQDQAVAAVTATGGDCLLFAGASMTSIVLTMAAIALGDEFILMRHRMVG